MNLKFAFMIVLVSCSTSCSNSSGPISISADVMGKTTIQRFLALSTGSALWTCYGGNYSSASGFVHSFSAYSENMQFPVVVWAADRKRIGHEEFMQDSEEPCFEMPGYKPWGEALARIGRWAGPYHAREFPGFVEIVFANSDQEQSIRKAMGRSVPPILFRSREAVDYLTMWHQVSEMDFKYDRTLLENAREWDRIRLMQVSDPEMPIGESLGKPFELGFLKFETTYTLDIDEFMPKLAAHIGKQIISFDVLMVAHVSFWKPLNAVRSPRRFFSIACESAECSAIRGRPIQTAAGFIA